MPSFLKLYQGEIPSIRLAVAVGATNATREDVNVGIWELTREQLLLILTDIGLKANPPANQEATAIRCDDVGIENRFFRLNPLVADWIDNTEPVEKMNFDFGIL